jgi:hypothetical protein
LLNEKYGEPDNIQIIKNKQIEGETIVKGDNGKIIERAAKSTFDLREGTFEENPLYIWWEKEDYHMKTFLRHKQNMSEIKFSFPEKIQLVKD